MLSIVMLAYNKWPYTKSALDDLFHLDRTKNEIIVVNNNSSDQTIEELKKYDWVKVIHSETNRGFAGGSNLGYHHSIGDVIMFLNNDIRVRKDKENWTDKIVLETQDDMLVGPTGGFVDPKLEYQFRYETNDTTNKPINYMSGWCLTATRQTWNKLKIKNYLGPFSEEFGLAYFEDTDISFRANKLNQTFKLIQVPLIHFGKVSTAQLNTSQLYTHARSVFLNKWGKIK